MQLNRRFFSWAFLGFLAAAAPANAQAFRGLGFIDPKAPGPFSLAQGVSGDGKVVVGQSNTGGSCFSQDAFRWTSGGGMVALGACGGAYGTSLDGSVVVGFTDGGKAFRWTSSDGVVSLGSIEGDKGTSAAYDVSSDGLVVVGRSSTAEGGRAFRWTKSGGFENLGLIDNFEKVNAGHGVSGDGKVVVGRAGCCNPAGNVAFRWTPPGPMESLGDIFSPPSLPWSTANGISADGQVVVGAGLGARPFRWANGKMSALPFLNPEPYHGTIAMDASANGSVVVGTGEDPTSNFDQNIETPWGPQKANTTAFIWRELDGTTRSLKNVLAELGLGAAVKCWRLAIATAVSDDGNVIVGYGVRDGQKTFEGWIAALSGNPFETENCSGGEPVPLGPLPFVLLYPIPIPGPPPVERGVQILGSWRFDEGYFLPGCPASRAHDAQGHVLDGSGLANHGCIENSRRRVAYSVDSYPLPDKGRFGMHLNGSGRNNDLGGYIFIPHNTSLEPATGMIEAKVKIDTDPSGAGAIVFAKSTFQFVRREPVTPVFDVGGQRRIIGRTVYQLEILPDRRLRAIVGNDDPRAPGPWTDVESSNAITLGAWNHIGMKWDGCRLTIIQNGVSLSEVPYDPVPLLGLSYQGTGLDPTFGPQTIPASIWSNESLLSGKIDDVQISSIPPCTQFIISSSEQLISNVRSLKLDRGLQNSLTSILDAAVAQLRIDSARVEASPFRGAAVNQLSAFINHVEAQRGKKIEPAAADSLISVARKIIAGLTAVSR